MKSTKYFLFLVLAIFVFPMASQAQVYRVPATAAPTVDLTNSEASTFVGDSAGYTYLFSFFNTVVGHGAGKNYNNDSDHTIIGARAAHYGTTGVDNVIIGARAGFRNNASDNTLVGNMAGYHNTTGFDLTFIGEDAGYYNTTGSDNVFMGEDAGYNNSTGNENTFIGNAAGRQNTTGFRNTAIGNEALFDLGGSNNTDAHHNTAIGDSAGIDNGEGIYNTYVGAGSGAANELASHNTFLGSYAGYDNNRTNSTNGVGANRNTFVGFRTGYFKREGEDNVGMGAYAGMRGFASGLYRVRQRTTFIGAAALVWADEAVALGFETNARKQYSMALGTQANSDGVNSMAIGYQANVTADNEVYIGNNAIASIGGIVNWTATSDGRVKSNLQENVPGLEFIDGLRPVTYQMDMEEEYAIRGDTIPDGLRVGIEAKKQTRYSGFVAQEVDSLAKAIGYEFSGVKVPDKPDEQLYGLRYAEFVVPLVKSVQELNAKLEEQNKVLAQQAAQIQHYEQLLAQQQKVPSGDAGKNYEAELAQYQQLLQQLSARLSILEANNNSGLNASAK